MGKSRFISWVCHEINSNKPRPDSNLYIWTLLFLVAGSYDSPRLRPQRSSSWYSIRLSRGWPRAWRFWRTRAWWSWIRRRLSRKLIIPSWNVLYVSYIVGNEIRAYCSLFYIIFELAFSLVNISLKKSR